MKVLMLKEYDNREEFGYYPQGHICEVSRPIGKYLVREGYAEESSGATNQDRFVVENRPPEQPQVVIMPFPVMDEEE